MMKLAGRCPNCDYAFDSAAIQKELRRAIKEPKPGDLLVCVGCGLWLVLEFDSQDQSLLVVREIMPGELLGLPDASLELMRTASKAIELIRTAQCLPPRRGFGFGEIQGARQTRSRC